MTCTHHLGHLPCANPEPHEGGPHGRGCIHHGLTVDDGTHDDRTDNQ